MIDVQINLPKPLEQHLKLISQRQFNGDISQTIVELLKNELKMRFHFLHHKEKKKRKPLTEYEVYGMWADREEMKDSAEWVRKQREAWKVRLEQ